MSTLNRYKVVWDGVAGLPGVSVFYSLGSGPAGADLKAFFEAIKALFPSGLTWQIPVAGDTIDSTTGQLNGSFTDAGGGTVTSTGSGIWASGTGAYVTWLTNTVYNGRKFVGRTFLCPIFGSAYQSDGTIVNAYVTTIQTAADALVTAGTPVIYKRPVPFGASNGTFAGITGALVPDKVTSLRTRRR